MSMTMLQSLLLLRNPECVKMLPLERWDRQSFSLKPELLLVSSSERCLLIKVSLSLHAKTPDHFTDFQNISGQEYLLKILSCWNIDFYLLAHTGCTAPLPPGSHICVLTVEPWRTVKLCTARSSNSVLSDKCLNVILRRKPFQTSETNIAACNIIL